jgi:transcriptional regulator with XRE-family HTH domain
MGLGARIGEQRRRKRESLQEVADAVGVSKQHIWDLEKGRTANPSMLLVEGLADHFGVTVALLMGEDPKASGTDPAIARMFRQAEALDPDDLALLDRMMQILLERQRERTKRGA